MRSPRISRPSVLHPAAIQTALLDPLDHHGPLPGAGEAENTLDLGKGHRDRIAETRLEMPGDWGVAAHGARYSLWVLPAARGIRPIGATRWFPVSRGESPSGVRSADSENESLPLENHASRWPSRKAEEKDRRDTRKAVDAFGRLDAGIVLARCAPTGSNAFVMPISEGGSGAMRISFF